VSGSEQSPVYLGSPLSDALVTVLMELGAELWVVKRRLQVLEQSLGQGDRLDEAPVDSAAAAHAAQEFVERVFSALQHVTH
jgi:hypothetical protein